MQGKGTEPKVKRLPTGVKARHSRTCRSLTGQTCNCKPAYRAWVYDKLEDRKTWKTFSGDGAFQSAKGWRASQTTALKAGKRIAPSRLTVREAADAWMASATARPPAILNRSGEPYKPAVLREYERNLRLYVVGELGDQRLTDIRRGDLQAFADRLVGKGLSASKVRNVMMPLRVICRHAIERDVLTVNPTSGLRLPTGDNHRERAASPSEATELLAALPQADRATWATAFYAGLRRGELLALRWSDVDLANGSISVSRSWDDVEGEITPKSKKGTRKVPIVPVLRDYLTEAKQASGRDGEDFVFGATATSPFTSSYLRKRAADAWKAENAKRARRREESNLTDKQLPDLVPIGLHECRHTFVSMMAAAGVPLERVGDYVGHASTYMVDRYRHLIEGQAAEDSGRLDEYLRRADTFARLEQLND